MLSLILLGLAFVYVLLLVGATYLGYRKAKSWYPDAQHKWIAGGAIGFLVVFLPVFWDAVPTLATHEWYCRQEAGFHVHKTLEQWRQENPTGETTIEPRVAKVQRADGLTHYDLNSRFRRETRWGPRSLGIRMRDERIVDTKSGAIIAQYLDFDTGIPNTFAYGKIQSFRDIKEWMDRDYCVQDRKASGLAQFAAMVEQVKALGGPK